GGPGSSGPDGRQGAAPSGGRAPPGLAAGIRRHLDALQEAADGNGGTRAAGTPGYDASVRYVADQLRRAGYRPEVQRFDATTARNRSAPLLELPGTSAAPRADEDFRPFAFSGHGEVAAASRPVDLPAGGAASTSGCEPSDFAGLPRGGIA